MPGIEIIQLSEDEWQLAKDIRARSVKEEPCAFGQNEPEAEAVTEEEWRRRLREGLYLFLRKDHQLLGVACLMPEKNEKLKHIAWIYSVYVAPELRGQRAGRVLLERLLETGIKKYPQLKKLMLNATVAQTRAIALYESLGFKKIGTLEKEMHIGENYYDAWMYVKFVEPDTHAR